MMLIWKGHGWLVAAITIAALIGIQAGVDHLMQDSQYEETHGWPKLLALVIAGILVLVIGGYLNDRIVADPATGQRTRILSDHGSLWIK
jgi:hypothetical protein